MHRGSSKAAGGNAPATETLPLSASSLGGLVVEVEVARAGRRESHTFHLPAGSRVRDGVRAAGLSPEGVAVLVDEVPVPLDQPLEGPVRLLVVPTFSGG